MLADAIQNAGLPGGIYEAIISYVSAVLVQLKIYGVVATLLGVVLCVLGFRLSKQK